MEACNKFYSHSTTIDTGYGFIWPSFGLNYGWNVSNHEWHEDKLVVQYIPFFNFLAGLFGALPLFVINFGYVLTPGFVTATAPILVTLYHGTKICFEADYNIKPIEAISLLATNHNGVYTDNFLGLLLGEFSDDDIHFDITEPYILLSKNRTLYEGTEGRLFDEFCIEF